MLLYIALAALILALLGAFLHPIALLLDVLFEGTLGNLGFLNSAKTFIADFLFWGFLGLLLLMAIAILRGRRIKAKGISGAEPRSEAPQSSVDTAPNSMKMTVAIIAYNEAPAIATVVKEFKAQEGVAEVIVIDNNSQDETAALASAAGARVVREIHQGYGYACLRGLREALEVSATDAVVLTEGDGTFTAKDLRKFQAYIPQADMVIGTRVVPGLVEKGSQMDYFFTWGNIVASALLRLRFWDSQFLGAARLSDVGCTYRVIRREALERILPDLVVGGHHFSLHMMLVALARGLSIVEIPITFRRRIGESKGASQSILKGLEVGLTMIWHIMTYKPRRSDDSVKGG